MSYLLPHLHSGYAVDQVGTLCTVVHSAVTIAPCSGPQMKHVIFMSAVCSKVIGDGGRQHHLQFFIWGSCCSNNPGCFLSRWLSSKLAPCALNHRSLTLRHHVVTVAIFTTPKPVTGHPR
jgi:hypothetical protein